MKEESSKFDVMFTFNFRHDYSLMRFLKGKIEIFLWDKKLGIKI